MREAVVIGVVVGSVRAWGVPGVPRVVCDAHNRGGQRSVDLHTLTRCRRIARCEAISRKGAFKGSRSEVTRSEATVLS